MSWLFSRALVEAFSEDTSLDGEPSAPSSGNPTQLAYLPPDRMTAFSRLSRFGMIFRPLTDDRGEALLTSYLAAFPVKTSRQPEGGQELMGSVAACGSTWRGWLAKYDLATSSWRTAQCSLIEDWGECLATWPRSGMTRGGLCWELPTSERRTSATESGFWPTPTTQDNVQIRGMGSAANSPSRGTTLGGAVRLWPTPQASDNRPRATANSIDRRIQIGKQVSLEAAVKFWPTPTAHNAKEAAFPSEYTRNMPTLAAQAGGQLNPTWVEWLMGWPLGWTDLKPLATARCHCALPKHSRSYQQISGFSKYYQALWD